MRIRALALLIPLLIIAAAQSAENRFALVIGNEGYPDSPVPGAVSDADSITNALKADGFQVQEATNTDLREFERAIDWLVRSVGRGDVALLYYVGKGTQIDAQRYLDPVDFVLARQSDIESCYSLSRVEEQLRGTAAGTKIVILDVTPALFRFARPPEGGDEPFEDAPGIFLAVSRFPWDSNFDQPPAGRGFAHALVGALRKPGLSLDGVFDSVRQEVGRQRNGVRWANGGDTSGFYFIPGGGIAGSRPGAPPTPPKRVRIGGKVMQANLISQTPPKYPLMARSSGTEGSVVFDAVVGVDGHIQQLDLVTGPPLLVDAARDAVRKWVYKPTLLHGDPVEVETAITINFTLH
jgi:protein TonB